MRGAGFPRLENGRARSVMIIMYQISLRKGSLRNDGKCCERKKGSNLSAWERDSSTQVIDAHPDWPEAGVSRCFVQIVLPQYRHSHQRVGLLHRSRELDQPMPNYTDKIGSERFIADSNDEDWKAIVK